MLYKYYNCLNINEYNVSVLTAFVIALRSKDEPVKDGHHLLQPLCECLEHIFFIGLKGTFAQIFRL